MEKQRKFLKDAIDSGLACNILDAADLITFVTPEVLAKSLPQAEMAKLLSASLDAGKMSPELVLETLGTDVLSEHVPMPTLWACLCKGAAAAIGDVAASRAPTTVDTQQPTTAPNDGPPPRAANRKRRASTGARPRPSASSAPVSKKPKMDVDQQIRKLANQSRDAVPEWDSDDKTTIG